MWFCSVSLSPILQEAPMTWIRKMQNTLVKLLTHFWGDDSRFRMNTDLITTVTTDVLITAVTSPSADTELATTLQWRHKERNGVSNHQPHECLVNRLFKAQIKENIKAPRHWPCEFPAQRASNAENVSIWWRHHKSQCYVFQCRHGYQRLWIWFSFSYIFKMTVEILQNIAARRVITYLEGCFHSHNVAISHH